MITFIIAAAVLILVALLFIIPPLLKPREFHADDYDVRNIEIAQERLAELKQSLEQGDIEEAEYTTAKQELEEALALDLSAGQETVSTGNAKSGRVAVVVLLVGLPVLSGFIYSQIGDPNALSDKPVQQAEMPAGHQPQMTMAEAIEKLKQRLEEHPDDAQGWFMLARSYAATDHFKDAVKAYRKTIELVGDQEPDLLVRYADAMVMANNRKFSPEAREVLQHVLSMNADHPQALWLAGMGAAEASDFEQALKYWYHLYPNLTDSPEFQNELGQMIASVEQHLPAEKVAALKKQYEVATTTSQPAADNVEISVNVSLSDELKDKVSPGSTLFVLARAMSGPPMPLAVQRLSADQLPLTVKLSDAMAMMPQMKLSGFQQVKVSAIVSKDEVANLVAGDLYGDVMGVAVKNGATVELVVDQVK